MADSVAEEIGDKAKAAVDALAFSGATVVKRKNPGAPEGSGSLPQISVSVLEDKSEPMDRRRRLVTYTLVVGIVRGGGTRAADNATVRKWRKQIVETIDDTDRETFAGLSNGAEIEKADYTGGRVPFEPAATAKDYDFSQLVFAVEVIEQRAPRT